VIKRFRVRQLELINYQLKKAKSCSPVKMKICSCPKIGKTTAHYTVLKKLVIQFNN
jgi:hypothetical protein